MPCIHDLEYWPGTEMIYLIGVPGSTTAPVKIGNASNVRARLIQIQRGESTPLKVFGMIGDPMRLDVLLTLQGERCLERALHATFRDRCIEGEWFYLGSAENAVQRVQDAADMHSASPQRVPVAAMGAFSPMRLPLVEPEPLTRLAQAAAQHHEIFRAWVDAGFTDDQAIKLLAAVLSVSGLDGWV